MRPAHVRLHSLFTSASDGDEWSASEPGRFTPANHWTGDWVDPTAGMDTLESRESNHDSSVVQAVAYSLYWLRYSGSCSVSSTFS
jgi:hypothetical protein